MNHPIRSRKRAKGDSGNQRRYHIAEWYGMSMASITDQERSDFAAVACKQHISTKPICPAQSMGIGHIKYCTKQGGVCSLREYERFNLDESRLVPLDASHHVVTICPHRFKERNEILEWVGETLIGTNQPAIATEVGFLSRHSGEIAEQSTSTSPGDSADRDSLPGDVGQIDFVLANRSLDPMKWCALELQAVYFSGPGMGPEFSALAKSKPGTLPFPSGLRRPDWRSSGPKRLMPQLQIKVPALRRWGKKMAVVIDEAFYAELGHMDTVQHVSNCDIAWFIVGYDEANAAIRLNRKRLHLTTLESAVEGLTAGSPVSVEEFERRIRAKLVAGNSIPA